MGRFKGVPRAAPVPLTLPFATFGDLEPLGLEAAVCCQKCGRARLLDAKSPALRDRAVAGQRFYCTMVQPDGIACEGMGSVTISRRGTWAEQQVRGPRSARPADEA